MKEPALVVEVDRSLVSTSLLWEGWIRLVFRRPVEAARSLVALFHGRSAFARRVARAAPLSVDELPLNGAVLDLVRRARSEGRPVVLSSSAHREQVEELAGDLGPDGAANDDVARVLDEAAGIEALRRRYGSFDYVAGAGPDRGVLEAARQSYVVSPSGSGGSVGGETTRIELDRPALPVALWRAARPHQWTKNVLLLLPIAAAHLTPTLDLFLTVAIGFLTLSLAASGVYLLNDLADLPADRRHEEKRERPLAAGDLSLPTGLAAALASVAGAAALGLSQGPAFAACVGAYLAINLGYSFGLKQWLLVDVILLAALYTVRVVAGAALVQVPLTDWFLAFSIFLFLSLALLKRVVELERSDLDGSEKLPGRPYRSSDVPLLRTAGVGSGLMSAVVYCLYIAGPQAEELYGRPELLWAGLPLFLYWLVRMWLLADRGEVDEDPVAHVVTDRATYVVFVAFLAVVYLAA